MLKSDFFYELPNELIAQTPMEPRDSSRLMCLKRVDNNIEHMRFKQLPALLDEGDVLVVNNSKVLPARLLGSKENSTGIYELLLLRERKTDEWECLARPGRRLHKGDILVFGDGSLKAEILSTLENGGKLVKMRYDTKTIYNKLEIFGKMPLPPYIKKQLSNNNDYQTIYAKEQGSAAAPTAGLHFTPELIVELQGKGVRIAEICLHVGLGTFRPVQTDNIEQHVMHSEWFSIGEVAANAVNKALKENKRVVAVGTTACRTLEAAKYDERGYLVPQNGETDIFITPGYKFKKIDGLITNFHLPESTLIMLISAFYGREKTLKAYSEAIKEKYRFFSFGDAMIIL